MGSCLGDNKMKNNKYIVNTLSLDGVCFTKIDAMQKLEERWTSIKNQYLYRPITPTILNKLRCEVVSLLDKYKTDTDKQILFDNKNINKDNGFKFINCYLYLTTVEGTIDILHFDYYIKGDSVYAVYGEEEKDYFSIEKSYLSEANYFEGIDYKKLHQIEIASV